MGRLKGRTWGLVGGVAGMLLGLLAMSLAWLGLIISLQVIASRWPQYGEVGGLLALVLLAPFFVVPLVAVMLGWRLGHRWDRPEG